MKNELAGRAFRALLLHLIARRSKQRAIRFRSNQLKDKALASLVHRVARRRQDVEKTVVIHSSHNLRVSSSVFVKWVSLHQRKLFHRQCLYHFERKFKAEYFARLARYTSN
jgi:hypothetical protein